MRQYLFPPTRSVIVRDYESRCRSLFRITVSRFNGFVLLMVLSIFLLSYFLVNQNTFVTPIYLSRPAPSSVTPRTRYVHSYVHPADKLVEDFVKELLDKSQQPSPCLVIIRSADGAIGNRMFLFASAYGLARLHQCDLYVAPWIIRDLRSIFTVHLNETPVHLTTDDTVVNRTGLFQRYSSCTLFSDLLRVPLHSNFTVYEMVGFYQAFGYFVRYRDEINHLFRFNQAAVKRNVPLVEQLLQAVWKIPLNLGNYTDGNVTHRYLKTLLTRPSSPLIPVTWIGLHIRRGDFLIFFKLDTNLAYIHLAMNYYRRKYVNCRFLIASDDKEFVRTHLGNQSDVFITPNSFHSGDDLAALALCEHSIVTAGSYGWWSAWLAGGNVLHDLHYPVASQNCIRDHYFPPWFLFPHNQSNNSSN